MRDIPASDVAVAAEAEVVGAHVVRAHRADGRGPDDAAVAVVVDVGVVEVRVEAPRRGVALEEGVLQIGVGDDHSLVALLEGVQARVRVFLAHVEHGRVVLQPVVRVVAEDPPAEVRVVEEEAAEVGVERLVAALEGDEVVAVREVAQVQLDEGFLQRPVVLRANRRAAAGEAVGGRELPREQRVDVSGVRDEGVAGIGEVVPRSATEEAARVGRDTAGFLHVEVVDVVNRRELDGPLDGLEHRLPAK